MIIKYELPNYAYNYYKKRFLNNEEVTYEIAQLKLSRNIELGYVEYDDGYQKIISYGSMLIKVFGNKITSLYNHKKPNPLWRKDLNRYDEINKFYNIEQ